MADKDESLESQGGSYKPDLSQIKKEIEQANVDASWYLGRMNQCKAWWHCEWPGMTPDGRQWSQYRKSACYPWEGCSDSRPHILGRLVNEHALIGESAFWASKVKTRSSRPFVDARESSLDQKMFDWTVFTQMKRELVSEVWKVLQWKFGAGLAFMGITWEQQRQLTHIPISLDMLSQLTQALGLPDISQRILDPDRAFDDDLATILQAISPVLPKSEATKMLTELRNTGQSEIPVPVMRINKPKWRHLRPFRDLWFPSETTDIQQARWTAERELISEAELTDRIVTDGYDDGFVEEALKHKGQFSALAPLNLMGQLTAIDSERDLVELFHYRMRVLDNGVPCMYKTILCLPLIGDGLYASHGVDPYEHQEYPHVAFCFKGPETRLIDAIGIPEMAYTDEIDIKRQQDGLNDRTDLIHQPPMIVPTRRAQSTAQSYAPRAVMTSLRPDAIQWPPLPPMDQTPVIVMQFKKQDLNERFPVKNAEGVDPQMVTMYRQHLANDSLSEFDLAFEQTLQLGEQYWTDQEWMAVTGQPKPQKSPIEISRKTGVTSTFDASLADPEVVSQKLDNLVKLLPLKDLAGGMLFNAAATLATDTDLADALTEDQMSPAAMKREKDDEYNAWGQIGAGIVPQKPMGASNQYRLQIIMQEILAQPQVQARLQQDQVFAKIAQDRIEFFQNQIQQYQVNPQVGRSLTTQPFAPNQAPRLTNAAVGQ